ncbi:MAG: cell division ATP-binding protein FtsE [Clostridiales bacterium]|nr:cell division ATP-binding protein FtsE [Clostridiales bacterium]PWL48498.1 MAG: cell division ATP-binding protein FtsE [Clostridiales bacterium]
MSSQNPPSTKKSAARYDITFEDVCMMYPNGNEALKDVNLTIRQGEFVFIVGRSGAGKTTLTKLLLCEERVSSGRLHIGPYKLEKLPRRRIPYLRRKMGVVFQDFRLFDNKTAYENIAFALRVTGEGKKLIQKRVPYFLNIVGLRDKAASYPTELSGGEKQRIAYARALVNNPYIVIADEPTGNIDPEMSRELLDMLVTINGLGKTVIVVTHEKELVDRYKKRVVTIEDGRIVSDRIGGSYDEETE